MVTDQVTKSPLMKGVNLKTLNIKDSVRLAAEKLSKGSFHSLPVVDDNADLDKAFSRAIIRPWKLN